MQNNSLTNFLLGVIAIALIVIVGLLAFNKNGRVVSQFHDDPVTRDLPGPAMAQNPNQDKPIVNGTQAQPKPLVSVTTMEDPHVTAAIEEGKSGPADFNGHYKIVYIGCGTECGSPALYDKTSGKLYRFDSAILAGFNIGGVSDDSKITSSVESDTLLFSKTVNGAMYTEKWKMVGTGFIKVS